MKHSSLIVFLILLALSSSCQKEPVAKQPQQNCRLVSYGVEGGITLTYSYSTDNKLVGISTSDDNAYKLIYTTNQADLYRVDKNGVTNATPASRFTLDNNGYILLAKYESAQNSHTVTNSYSSSGYLVSRSSSQSAQLISYSSSILGNPSSSTITSTIGNLVLGITTNEFYMDKPNQLPTPFPYYFYLTLQPGFLPSYDLNILTGDLLIGMNGKGSSNLLKKTTTPNILTSTGLGTNLNEFNYDLDKDGKVIRTTAIYTYPNRTPVSHIVNLQYECL